jgi:hypothetical protein
MSGIRCAAGAAALEAELLAVDGVLHAAVRARRDRVYVEMVRLAPVDAVVRLLASHGYRVGEGLVRATVWVDASEERLKALRDEVAAWPCVSYCWIYAPTERVELGLRLHGDWQRALPDLCRCLCEARGGSGPMTRSLEASRSTRVEVTGDVHNRSETQ